MAQISKRYISPEVLNKALNIFLTSILKIDNKKTLYIFFNEFLTPTEKIVLSKRLVCFYLLLKNVSILDSSETLKLSTATVAKFKVILNNSTTIKAVLAKILKTEGIKRMFDKLYHEYVSPPLKYGTDWGAGIKDFKKYNQRRKSSL